MILTILFASMFVFGLVISATYIIIFCFTNKNPEFLIGIAGFFLILGLILSLLFGGIALGKKVNEDLDYEEMVLRYDNLNERLESMNNGVEFSVTYKDEVYKDILEYNNEVVRCRIRRNNPWFSWFYNPRIAKECELIDYEKHAKLNNDVDEAVKDLTK